MKELLPTQKLDAILSILKKCKECNQIMIKTFLKTEEIEMDYNEIQEISYKLIKDEYAYITNPSELIHKANLHSDRFCASTFEGKIFIGYHRSYEINQQKMKIQNLKDWMLISGTWLAGIGALSLVVWEIYKQYFLHH